MVCQPGTRPGPAKQASVPGANMTTRECHLHILRHSVTAPHQQLEFGEHSYNELACEWARAERQRLASPGPSSLRPA